MTVSSARPRLAPSARCSFHRSRATRPTRHRARLLPAIACFTATRSSTSPRPRAAASTCTASQRALARSGSLTTRAVSSTAFQLEAPAHVRLTLDAREPAFAVTPVARCEHLDQLRVEGRDVVGLAARHEAAVDDDFLVDALRAGVLEVGRQQRPRVTVRSRTMPASISTHGPWQIAPTGLPARRIAHEWTAVLVHAQGVGVADAAGEHERVVVGCLGDLHRRSTLKRSALSKWLKPWISPLSDRDELELCPGSLQGLPMARSARPARPCRSRGTRSCLSCPSVAQASGSPVGRSGSRASERLGVAPPTLRCETPAGSATDWKSSGWSHASLSALLRRPGSSVKPHPGPRIAEGASR